VALELPHDRGARRRSAGVLQAGRRQARQLVAGLLGLAGGALRRPQARADDARQRRAQGRGARARHLRPRRVTMAAPSTPVRAEPPGWGGRPLAETRWTLELARLVVDPVFVTQADMPRGDGRPVVLVPGFLAGDQTLLIMAGWLRRLGYEPHRCGIVSNV